jgi:hypothetical protein
MHRGGRHTAALGVTAIVGLWIASRAACAAGDAVLLHPLLADAYRQLAAGRLRSGRRALGRPLLADAVVGVVPAVLRRVHATPFPHWRGLDVSVVLHTALSTGLVWFLRQLGPHAPAPRAGTSSPESAPSSRNWHEIGALAYWPWLFGAAVGWRSDRGQAGVLAAGALAGPVYAGYPEFAPTRDSGAGVDRAGARREPAAAGGRRVRHGLGDRSPAAGATRAGHGHESIRLGPARRRLAVSAASSSSRHTIG